MRVLVCRDTKLDLDLPKLVEILNHLFSNCSFKLGAEPFSIPGRVVDLRTTNDRLTEWLLEKTQCCIAVPPTGSLNAVSR